MGPNTDNFNGGSHCLVFLQIKMGDYFLMNWQLGMVVCLLSREPILEKLWGKTQLQVFGV